MKFLVDEDLDNRILRGLLRRMPELDVIRVQDTEIASADDPDVIQWAASNNRILLSHDVNTMTYHFQNRLQKGKQSPGIIFIPQSVSIGVAIDDLMLIARFSIEDEYKNRMIFIPL